MPSPVTHNPAKYFALAPPPRCLCTVYAASPLPTSAHIVSAEQLIFLYLLPRLDCHQRHRKKLKLDMKNINISQKYFGETWAQGSSGGG